MDIHRHLALQPQTLFSAVQLLERFLAKRATPWRDWQLAGAAALLVAAKAEGDRPPGSGGPAGARSP